MQTLLATKLFPPTPSHHQIARANLVAALQTGLQQGRILTLVSAPAGYGKSVAVVEWLHTLTPSHPPLNESQAISTAWLSLDEADNDLGRFFTYFLAALRQRDESFCPELFAALHAGQPPSIEILITTLVNAMLNWKSHHILALDDFHHIQDKTILDGLTGLLMQAPRHFHLVLLTREDPPLPLARLRARNQLTEIRAADLRFSHTEASQLFREGLGVTLSDADISHLTERTEGWATGLQLAGVSLQGRENPGAFVQSLSGSHRFILDYLTDEALKTQPPEIQDFLLKTSILQRLSGDLCAAVTERSDSARLLEKLLAANLFIIPLDDEGHWYRYHHLFAELLQHRLKRECANSLPDLHQRASRWYEKQDLPVASIEHAWAAGDPQRVAVLLEKYGWRLLTREHAPMLTKWLQALPEALRNSKPGLNTILVWGKILHSKYQEAIPYLLAAQTAQERLPSDHSEARTLQADLLALQSFIVKAQGKNREALALAEQARALAPRDDMRLMASTALALGTAYRTAGQFAQAIETLEEAMRTAHAMDDHVTAMVAMAHLSLIWYPLGRLRLLAERAKMVIERAETISQVAPVMIGSVHAVLGQVYYEWNQVEQARESLLHGIRLATLSAQPASVVYGNVHLARLHQGQGDLQAATECLRMAGEALEKGAPGWARPDWIAQNANLLMAQGKLNEAETMLCTSGVSADEPVHYGTDVLHLAWLRWMIASRHPNAFSLAERIVTNAEAEGRNGTLIVALVLGAQVSSGTGWLARAQKLGEPEGYQRVFMEAGGTLRPIFAPGLFEPLTARELQVLRLLAEGLSYAEIAERMVVSINTVRYHVKGVYGKLGVEKQTQAVERGRELGLV